MTSVAPFLIFFASAVVVAFTSGWLRSAVLLATPVLGAANLYMMTADTSLQVALLGFNLELIRVDKLSILFGYLFHLAAFLGIIFALHVKNRSEQVAALIYAGSALGAVFAGDLVSLFIFWELLALSSVIFILASGTERAYGASMRYLLIQVLSGVILMAGAIAYAKAKNTISFDYIGLQPLASGLEGIGSWLILLAIGIKCVFPFLHNWLTDAYPEATPSGTVFLSAFTTKVAVYALARAYPGTELLVYVGAVMALYPIFFAVIENDLRRVLSYSMMNQIGFMVCGIGIGTALAVNGAVSHAFNDVVFKGLLFMTMGAVMYRTGKTRASDLGGLFRTMPWTTGFCLVGALSISAVPLFSGFVSKSMIMVAAIEEGHPVVWLALVFASAGVVEHAGIKIPYFAFFAHDSGLRPKEAPTNMLIAMGLAAAVCVFNGAYPWVLYSYLPHPVDYVPYTTEHVVTQIQLLCFAVLGVATLHLLGRYPAEIPSRNLDAEWIYRKLLPGLLRLMAPLGRLVRSKAVARRQRWLERAFAQIYRHHGPQGVLARTWPTGSMAIWTAILLAMYLMVYYLSH